MLSTATTKLQSVGFTALSVEELLQQVPDVFGVPCVSSLTGSIANGFGNKASDIDVYTIVEQESIAQLPISSYIAGRRTDIRFFSSSTAQSWLQLLEIPQRPSTRHDWLAWRSTMDSIVRFTTGITLDRKTTWEPWLESVASEHVTDAVELWWTLEAARRYSAAILLQSTRPLDAAERMCETVVALLDARAAAGGELYFGPKWLAHKHERLGYDTSQLAQLAALKANTTDASFRFQWAKEQAEALDDRLGSDNITIFLEPNAGVETERVLDRPIAHRWQIESMPLDLLSPAATIEDLRWTGALNAVPQPLVTLFGSGMLWLAAQVGR